MWQVSNFGNASSPGLERLVLALRDQGLVDDVVCYTPKTFTAEAKQALVSRTATADEIGGKPSSVSEQFFNELTKREEGRQLCQAQGCTHFICLDCDEFYMSSQLAWAKQCILENGYDATACKMRFYLKHPTIELLPYEEFNCVPLIYKIDKGRPFRLAAKYAVTLDPTRRIEGVAKFRLFERDEIEMHHYSLVRVSMRSKLDNISNKANMSGIETFVAAYERWQLADGAIHPHPYFRQHFTLVSVVPNYFDIDLDKQCVMCRLPGLMVCSKCKKVRYCARQCQQDDWKAHKATCLSDE